MAQFEKFPLQGEDAKVSDVEAMREQLAGAGPIATDVLYNNAKSLASRVTPYIDGVIPAGTIVAYSGTTLPNGWLWCDGSLQLKSLYADLYAALGANRYGTDTATQFMVPDFRGRFQKGSSTIGGPVSINFNANTGSALSNHSHSITVDAPINVNVPQNALTNRTSGNGSANHDHTWSNTGNHAHGFAQSTTPNVNRGAGNLATAGNLTHGHSFAGDGAHNHLFTAQGASHTHTTDLDHRHNATAGNVDLAHVHLQSQPASTSVDYIIKT